MILSPRRRISPSAPGGTSLSSSSTRRASTPGIDRPDRAGLADGAGGVAVAERATPRLGHIPRRSPRPSAPGRSPSTCTGSAAAPEPAKRRLDRSYFAKFGVIDPGDVHRRRAGEDGAAMLLDLLEYPRRLEAGDEHNRRRPRGAIAVMRHSCRRYGRAARRAACDRPPGRRTPGMRSHCSQLAMKLRCVSIAPFDAPGRAGGVADRREVVRRDR